MNLISPIKTIWKHPRKINILFSVVDFPDHLRNSQQTKGVDFILGKPGNAGQEIVHFILDLFDVLDDRRYQPER